MPKKRQADQIEDDRNDEGKAESPRAVVRPFVVSDDNVVFQKRLL
jgi:hypothetical protein